MARKQVTRPKLPRNNLATRQRATVIPAQIRIADYPLLADLCWNVAITELPARYAFAI
ncbi:MAG: hypothetical protein H7Y02_05335 [Candidatus Obscuribacterales bacterium]|nr:hypothetical protein [Steroidobacteraceae bacterium]